ncbi:MAG: thioredoxin family protein [Acidobacteriota bacterium]
MIRGGAAAALLVVCATCSGASGGLLGAATPRPDSSEDRPGIPGDEAVVLLGVLTPEEVLDHDPAYQAEFEAYEPDPGAVRLIAGGDVAVSIEVFFGTWCSDSAREVPRLLRILERARAGREAMGKGPLPIMVRLVGVDRDKREPADVIGDSGIDLVPTILVRRDGREIGRIVEAPQGSLEEELALLVLEAAEASGAP